MYLGNTEDDLAGLRGESLQVLLLELLIIRASVQRVRGVIPGGSTPALEDYRHPPFFLTANTLP